MKPKIKTTVVCPECNHDEFDLINNELGLETFRCMVCYKHYKYKELKRERWLKLAEEIAWLESMRNQAKHLLDELGLGYGYAIIVYRCDKRLEQLRGGEE